MNDSSLVYYLKRCALNKIKEFISGGGDVLKPLPHTESTALKFVLSNFNYDYLSSRDEIILYLIEEETKARHAKNLWNVSEWIMYVEVALYNKISEKIVLNLIHIGSTNNIDFKIDVFYVSIAVNNSEYSAALITNLFKYCLEDELRVKSDMMLITAIRNDRGIDVIKLLVDAGANLHAIDHSDYNLFYMISCQCCDGNICKSELIIDLLMKNRVDIKMCDYEYNKIIHFTDCQYLIKLAIQNGVSIEQKNCFDYSPLMQAIDLTYVKKAEILLQLGADPNSALNLYRIISMIQRTDSIRWTQERMQNLHCMESLIDVLLYHSADFLAYTVENESLIDCLLRLGDVFTDHIKKIVCNYMFFTDMNNFSKNFPQLRNSAFWLSFLEECKVEQDKMKSISLNDGLTLNEFCNLKKYYKSKFVDVSVLKFVLNNKEITVDFPIYHNFIEIRIKDNVNKRWKKILSNVLENIIIASFNNQDEMSESIELNYDCLHYSCKFLNSKVLYNLFLASIKD